MQRFQDRFRDLRRVIQQQVRLQEHTLLAVQARIAELQRQQDACRQAIQATALRDVEQARAQQSLLANSAEFRQKMLTVYQTLQNQIAELESERADRRRTLQNLRTRLEQLELYRDQAQADWKLRQRRARDAAQLDAIGRGIFWPGGRDTAQS